MIVIRFPNGDFAYDLTDRPPPCGGRDMRRNGVLWVVTQITHEVVHVKPVDAQKSQ